MNTHTVEPYTVQMAPKGAGKPPINSVGAAYLKPGQKVRWSLDQNGWATGFQIVDATTPPQRVRKTRR